MDPTEMCWPKIEMDTETDTDLKRDGKVNWNSENTMKLIENLEKECRELWDLRHPMYKHRWARQAKHDYLANLFGTTVDEICRKIHNLRTQLNNELRKIKRRQSSTPSNEIPSAGVSGWEYFDALSFLVRSPLQEADVGTVDGVNLALAEFQAHEEEEFGSAAKARGTENGSPSQVRRKPRVAASAPPPLPPSANPLMWPEEAVPRLRPGNNADECQIFGDFVASELRMLRSDESRKKLKRLIQKSILQIGEEEDVNIITTLRPKSHCSGSM